LTYQTLGDLDLHTVDLSRDRCLRHVVLTLEYDETYEYSCSDFIFFCGQFLQSSGPYPSLETLTIQILFPYDSLEPLKEVEANHWKVLMDVISHPNCASLRRVAIMLCHFKDYYPLPGTQTATLSEAEDILTPDLLSLPVPATIQLNLVVSIRSGFKPFMISIDEVPEYATEDNTKWMTHGYG